MRVAARAIVMTALLWLMVFSVAAQQSESPPIGAQIDWQRGPSGGSLGQIAQVQIPDGYVFAGAKDTRMLLEAMHNPTNGNELGFLAPAGADWFLVFEFDEVGYIKDDEKNSLDADAILKAIKKGNDAGNQERAKRGWVPLNITGWEQPPRYNPDTHNLEWAIKAESDGHGVINWNTRLLGRGGVMKVTLVAGPEILRETMPQFQTLVGGFAYKTGQRYAEFHQGDKMAKYGLSALVVGGAAAVATKTGFLKSIWKLLVIGFVAVVAFLKKFFGRKKTTEIDMPRNE